MRLPIVLVLIVFAVSILVDIYIISSILRLAKSKKRTVLLWCELISILACYGVLIAVMCIPVRKEGSAILTVMWLLYSYLSIYIPKIIFTLFSGCGRLIKRIIQGNKRVFSDRKKVTYYGSSLGIIFGAIVFAGMWWGVLYTRNQISVNKIIVESPKLPAGFNNYKIVQFSDAHVGTWGNDTLFISRLVNTINSLKPDVIVFTGDIVNRETIELEPFLSVLSRLRARDGVFSIMGNHDYGDYVDWNSESAKRANRELMKAWQKQIGWKSLDNEHRFIVHGKDTVVMIGVENWGEPPFHQYGKLTDAYPLNRDSVHNLNDSRYKILLTHNPEHWRREVSGITNVDLTLSGHTHAMQLMLVLGDYRWSPSKFKYENWGGLYSKMSNNSTPMYLNVNVGSGEVGMPSRLAGAYPEVTEIILKKINK